jgi:heptosyltransferase-2
MATPFLQTLRGLLPGPSIHVFCRAYVAEVFRRSSAVDCIIECDSAKGIGARVRALRAERPPRGWGVGFVLPPSFSSAFTAFLSGARRRVGYAGEMRRFLLTDSLAAPAARGEHLSRMYVRLAERVTGSTVVDIPLPVVVPPYRWQDTVAARRFGGSYIVIAPGSAYGAAKEWPLERYASLAERLSAHTGMRIVSVGTTAEAGPLAGLAATAPVLSVAGELTSGELLAVLRGAALVIGNDSGPVHLAAAMGRPTVAIFGSTSPAWTAPRGIASRVVAGDVACAPCFKRECPEGVPRCLLGIEVEDLFRASCELLEEVRS